MGYSSYKIKIYSLLVIVIASTSTFSLFTGRLLKNNRNSDMNGFRSDNLTTSANVIAIITPENKTYTEPMNGYYPATYGFEDDKLYSMGDNISFVSTNSIDPNTEVSIVSELDLHKKVLKVSDYSNTGNVEISNTFSQNQSYGIVEFWVRTSNHRRSYIKITQGLSPTDENQVDLSFTSTGTLDYYDTAWHTIQSITLNEWYHFKIEFNCASIWNLWIDGVKKSGSGWNYWGNPNFLSSIHIVTENIDSNWELYFDAFGYSWDQNYNIGDNLDEGLLLSYDNITNFNWTGYSLDGQANITINGNTTIPMTQEGFHTIQLFGFDSIGTNFNSELIYFTFNTSQGSTPSPNPIPLQPNNEINMIMIGIISTGGISIGSVLLIKIRKNKKSVAKTKQRVKYKTERERISRPEFERSVVEQLQRERLEQEINERERMTLGIKEIERKKKIKIKKTVLDLGSKFTRLGINEIAEVCKEAESLIISTVREMIRNKEVYAQFFESSKSVAFDQQANFEDIDKLMKSYKDWEEKDIGKKEIK